MANVTWSSTAKGANVVLSGGNLTVTWSGGGGAVLSSNGLLFSGGGKYYWECTFTNTAGVGAGIANYNANLAVPAGPGMVIVNAAGGVYVNQWGSTAATLGAFSNGGVCCIAFDVGTRLIWIRNGAAGSWNGSGTADPVAEVGGISVAAIIPAGSFSLSAVAYAAAAGGGIVTGNFGDSAFAGVVPSGYTSGFPATATSEIVTQAAVEEWASPIPPPMQVTQSAIEQWAATSNVSTQINVTQVAVEEWGPLPVTVTPPSGGQLSGDGGHGGYDARQLDKRIRAWWRQYWERERRAEVAAAAAREAAAIVQHLPAPTRMLARPGRPAIDPRLVAIDMAVRTADRLAAIERERTETTNRITALKTALDKVEQRINNDDDEAITMLLS